MPDFSMLQQAPPLPGVADALRLAQQQGQAVPQLPIGVLGPVPPVGMRVGGAQSPDAAVAGQQRRQIDPGSFTIPLADGSQGTHTFVPFNQPGGNVHVMDIQNWGAKAPPGQYGPLGMMADPRSFVQQDIQGRMDQALGRLGGEPAPAKGTDFPMSVPALPPTQGQQANALFQALQGAAQAYGPRPPEEVMQAHKIAQIQEENKGKVDVEKIRTENEKGKVPDAVMAQAVGMNEVAGPALIDKWRALDQINKADKAQSAGQGQVGVQGPIPDVGVQPPTPADKKAQATKDLQKSDKVLGSQERIKRVLADAYGNQLDAKGVPTGKFDTQKLLDSLASTGLNHEEVKQALDELRKMQGAPEPGALTDQARKALLYNQAGHLQSKLRRETGAGTPLEGGRYPVGPYTIQWGPNSWGNQTRTLLGPQGQSLGNEWAWAGLGALRGTRPWMAGNETEEQQYQGRSQAAATLLQALGYGY